MSEALRGDDHCALAVLVAFAVAQPLYDLTAQDPQFLVGHGLRPGQLLLLAPALVLVPTLVLSAIGSLLNRWRPAWARSWVTAVTAVLVILAALPVSRGLPLSGWLSAPIAVVVGVGWALVYRRTAARLFVRFLSPALVVFPGLFLLNPNVRPLFSLPPPAPVVSMPESALKTTPVILVVFDELSLTALLDPQDRVHAGRFPSFASLAAHSHWFRNATTVHNYTVRAMPALLSGRYPVPGSPAIATHEAHPQNLFSWFGGSFEISSSEPWTRLFPPHLRQDLAHDERLVRHLIRDLGWVYLHAVSPPWLARRLPRLGFDGRVVSAEESIERDRMDRFASQAVAIEPGGGAQLFLLYSLLPHSPLEYLPSGRRYNDPWVVPEWSPEVVGGERWEMHQPSAEANATLVYARYLRQVAAVDLLLGTLLDHLRQIGLYDPALLVVTADHGAEYSPGGQRRGTPEGDPRSELMPIPMFFKLPHQRQGAIHDQPAETVDVLPTLADLLGTPLPWRVDGHSLFDPSAPSRQRLRFMFQFDGEETVMRLSPDPGARRRAVDYWTAKMAPSADGDPFGFGPHSDLVGRRPADLPLGDPSDYQVSWLAPEGLNRVDLEQEPLPAHFVARLQPLEGAAPPPKYWALVLNGTVAAVVPYERRHDNRLRLSAVVPAEALRDGANEASAWAIRQVGSVRSLHWARSRSADPRARSIFEQLDDELFVADAETGFEGLYVAAGVVAEHRAGLQLTARAPPSLTMGLDLAGVRKVAVFLVVDSPASTKLCLYYQTVESRRFWWTRSRCQTVSAGRNEVHLAVQDEQRLAGDLQVRLGSVPGTYVVHRLEVRGQADR